jgi:hypothetical protein
MAVMLAAVISVALENALQYSTIASAWSVFMCAMMPAAERPSGSGAGSDSRPISRRPC